MQTSRSIRFLQRRVLAQYEHAELEITDVISKDDNLSVAIKDLISTVQDALYGKGEFSKDAPKAVAPVLEKITKPKKEEAKTSEPVEKETPKQEEVVSPVEKPLVEEKKEEPKKAAKKETKVVTKVSKDTAYDRTLDTHKNNLGVFLDASFPNWRKSDNLKKAGEASKALQGTSFLDASGNILDSFKEAFSAYMVDLV